jgi:hypothetical protein
MNEHELVWAMLPEGLAEYFDIEGFEKDDLRFRIILVEKNIVPVELAEEYRGKKVVNTVLNDILLEDFPIRGRKGEILFRRRSWKFEGVDHMLTRKVALTFPGTKINNEFAAFLKGLD